ncbi:MAG: phage portal protein [Lachnospiraceae bacterium]|nr:phage portal protein [Lachnospiraceae bacterium]
MAKNNKKLNVRVVKARDPSTELITKAETPTQLNRDEEYSGNDWIEPPTLLEGYEALVENSPILPQCIRAYRHNIAGFGIGVRYIDDEEETPEKAAEYTRMQEIIECLTLEDDTKEVFEDIIEARETYGIAYLEVIRNNEGEVAQIEFVRDTPSMRKTKPLDYQDMMYYHHGQVLIRKKRFRKYKQIVGGKTVYYKEFGDPRVMDNRTGEFTASEEDGGEGIELEYQANEILEFSIGTKPYGTVRWIGQVLGVDGARRAEQLNNNYFRNGRHTPLAIIISGGTLSDEAYTNLQSYMNDIKGEDGQHAFLLLETEAVDSGTVLDTDTKPQVELKDMASILQKDELFQEYQENTRKKVQSAFQLPDLYVAYTTDFNRATSQTAQEVTEEQVFQPERGSLAWILNNKLLNGYQFKYVEAFFKAPNISNPDDLYKLMTIVNAAGGLTPNKAKDLLFENLGEISEDYEGDWADVPLAMTKGTQGSTASHFESLLNSNSVSSQIEKAIAKARINHEDEIVSVLKEVRRQLIKMGGDTDEAEKTV